MKREWSSLAGLNITTDEEQVLAPLSGVFMNPETGQIIAFLAGLTRVLVPVDVQQWKKDHLIVSDKEALVLPTEILRLQEYGIRRSFLNGKRVRSASGKNMGKIRDFQIEVSTSSIIEFMASKKFLGIEWAESQFSYKDIQEVTEKAIILSIEPEQKAKQPRRAALPV